MVEQKETVCCFCVTDLMKKGESDILRAVGLSRLPLSEAKIFGNKHLCYPHYRREIISLKNDLLSVRGIVKR